MLWGESPTDLQAGRAGATVWPTLLLTALLSSRPGVPGQLFITGGSTGRIELQAGRAGAADEPHNTTLPERNTTLLSNDRPSVHRAFTRWRAALFKTIGLR